MKYKMNYAWFHGSLKSMFGNWYAIGVLKSLSQRCLDNDQEVYTCFVDYTRNDLTVSTGLN